MPAPFGIYNLEREREFHNFHNFMRLSKLWKLWKNALFSGKHRDTAANPSWAPCEHSQSPDDNSQDAAMILCQPDATCAGRLHNWSLFSTISTISTISTSQKLWKLWKMNRFLKLDIKLFAKPYCVPSQRRRRAQFDKIEHVPGFGGHVYIFYPQFKMRDSVSTISTISSKLWKLWKMLVISQRSPVQSINAGPGPGVPAAFRNTSSE